MKIYMRQTSNCIFIQNETSIIVFLQEILNSTSTKIVSINDIIFSSQIFYLIIKNLYHKQRVLLVKNEKIETSNSFFIQSKLQFVASFEFQTKFKFFKFNVFSIDFILFDVDDIIDFINQTVNSSQTSYQYIVKKKIFIYEQRLITFKKWFYIIFIFKNLVAIEFYHDSDTEYFVICSKYDLKLNIKRISIKTHMRQSLNCVFI